MTAVFLLHPIYQCGTIESFDNWVLNRSESIKNNVLIVERMMPHSVQPNDIVG